MAECPVCGRRSLGRDWATYQGIRRECWVCIECPYLYVEAPFAAGFVSASEAI